MLQVERMLESRFPALTAHPPVARPTLSLLKRLLREREVNAFLEGNRGIEGLEFVEKVLDYFNFSYSVVGREKENIPPEGRVVIVANHPLGALDGLALLKLVSEVRADVRVVANDLLMQLRPLHSLLLPVDNLGQGTTKANVEAIRQSLENDEAVIVFPSGEVSRAGPKGIRDGRWRAGFLRFAERARAPVLPVHLDGKNSTLFYSLSMLYKPLSSLLLVREMFRQRAMTLPVRIGELIPWEEIASLDGSREEKVKRITRQVYSVRKNRVPLFRTEKPIAHPEARSNLRRELQDGDLLGETRDGKQIFLFDPRGNSSVLREIGRLREVAFRRVGEGTGMRRDLDSFDARYRHLVLWDDRDLEVAGAYRIGDAMHLLEAEGPGLYSQSLFQYGEGMAAYLPRALELGRSFVQPRYWGMRSLDYLWYGIGAYLRRHPEIRYLFGPVTISGAYPTAAKDLLVHFYRLHFGDGNDLARARRPYRTGALDPAVLGGLFDGMNYDRDFRVLKEELTRLGVTVPTLYKQYTELCEPGGARFLDFSVDPLFSDCVDGLVLVDLEALKPARRERYLGVESQRISTPAPLRACA